jgi:ArsR family transcriptional regulator, lead/cadmium/zinc/bismuth-responsive transcriptional repressor
MSICSYIQLLMAPELTTSATPVRPADTCEVWETDEARVARVRQHLLSEGAALTLADAFRVLGDPTRVRILDALSRGELCVCNIAAAVGLSESAVSHQLRLLRSRRLVRPRRAGRMVFYAIDDQHIMDLFAQGRRHVEEHD